jgi:VIT1/CCC1 family predicted Fe2+/Mn2+ transporter
LFAATDRALAVSVLLSGAALFAVGATLSLYTGRNAWFSGARMLAIGAAAGAFTYFIGRTLGVSLA